MSKDQHVSRYTMIGVATVFVVIGAFFILDRIAGSPDETAAGPVPQVRQ